MLIKIYKIEQLVGKDSGRPYWRLETDKGKMSAFDKPIADALYEAWHDQKEIEVDAQPSKDEKYVNIRKLGAEKKGYDTPEKQRRYDKASEEHKHIYGEKEPEPMPMSMLRHPTEKPQDLGKDVIPEGYVPKFNPISMYVSYAKDIFIGLLENIKPAIKDLLGKPEFGVIMASNAFDNIMKKSEDLVKQAHKSFS